MTDMSEYRRLLREYKGAVVTYYGISPAHASEEAEAAMVNARKELDAYVERLAEDAERLRQTVVMFASVIRAGSGWTLSCDAALDAARKEAGT
jgi:predicted metal-binding protein